MSTIEQTLLRLQKSAFRAKFHLSEKEMIEHEKSKYGWEFLFLGANIDAVETAKHFGISEDRAVNYHSDSVGTRLNYEVVSCAITSMRSGAPMSADWKAPIEADYKTRKGEKN